MNKEELLAYILAKPQILSLSDPRQTEETQGYKKYIVSAVVTTGEDAMTMQTIGFYENVESGDCCFMNREPFPDPVIPFTSKVVSKIGLLMTAGTIKAGFLGAADQINKTVLVTVVMPDNSKPELLVFEKPDGTLDYIQLS